MKCIRSIEINHFQWLSSVTFEKYDNGFSFSKRDERKHARYCFPYEICILHICERMYKCLEIDTTCLTIHEHTNKAHIIQNRRRLLFSRRATLTSLYPSERNKYFWFEISVTNRFSHAIEPYQYRAIRL